MQIRSWYCDREGCESAYTEVSSGAGAPKWGGLVGVTNEDGSAIMLCPSCLHVICGLLSPSKEEKG
jgi:hypothetical protein